MTNWPQTWPTETWQKGAKRNISWRQRLDRKLPDSVFCSSIGPASIAAFTKEAIRAFREYGPGEDGKLLDPVPASRKTGLTVTEESIRVATNDSKTAPHFEFQAHHRLFEPLAPCTANPMFGIFPREYIERDSFGTQGRKSLVIPPSRLDWYFPSRGQKSLAMHAHLQILKPRKWAISAWVLSASIEMESKQAETFEAEPVCPDSYS